MSQKEHGKRVVTSTGRFLPWVLIGAQKRPECVDYSLFETLPESQYSSLMPYQAGQVAKVFLGALPIKKAPQLIIDSTAHIGADTANLANTYKNCKIIAIEKNQEAFQCLQKNMQRLFPGRITSVCEDCRNYLEKFQEKADLVYVDPEWGGPEYYRKEKLMLHLSEVPVFVLIRSILQRQLTRTVILKAPFNFDIEQFMQEIDFPVASETITNPVAAYRIYY